MRAWSDFTVTTLYSKDPMQKLSATHVGGGIVRVTSRTVPGTYHYVDTLDESCSCPGYEHYGKCWHLEASRYAYNPEGALKREIPAFAGVELVEVNP